MQTFWAALGAPPLAKILSKHRKEADRLLVQAMLDSQTEAQTQTQAAATRQYDFDEVVDRANTASMKWDRYNKDGGKDVLPLWVGDTDFKAAPEIHEAIRDRLAHGVLGYTSPPESLKQIIVERLAQRGDWHIDPDWLVFLPGLVPALFIACHGLSEPQSSVAIPASIYGPFRAAARRTGRRILPVPLVDKNRRPVLTAAELKRTMQLDTRLLLFCNPQNPGGTAYTRGELQELAELCRERDLIVCSDEIHCDLIFEGKHTHLASLSDDMAQRTVTLLSPSKTFNIAGLACGFAVIANPELRERFKAAAHAAVSSVSLLSYTATEAAYRHGEHWHAQMLAYLAANRDWLHGQLCGLPGVQAVAPQATFFAWLDLRSTGIEQVGEHFERFGLGLSDGPEFGSPGWVRLNFGTRRALLEEAVQRFKKALAAA